MDSITQKNENGKRYLSIEEKKKLLSEGKHIPLYVYVNPKEEKKRKKKKEKISKKFAENIGI